MHNQGQTARPDPSATPWRTVVRQRLLDLVSQGVQGPLTLVSAPAGFGKTILLFSWEALGTWGSPVRHITVDAAGEHATASLQSVLDGLHLRGPASPKSPRWSS